MEYKHRYVHIQKLNGLGLIGMRRVSCVFAESPAIRKQIGVLLRNSRTRLSIQLAIRRLRRIGMERQGVKRGNAHATLQSRRRHANSLHNFAQKSRAILETSSVLPFPRVRAQKFVTQISVTMFYVDEIETEFGGNARRAVKFFDDSADFSIREKREIVPQTEPPIPNRMAIQSTRLRARVRIRFD